MLKRVPKLFFLVLICIPAVALNRSELSAAIAHLQNAVAESESLRSPNAEMDVLAEAGDKLRLVDATVCLSRIENIYQAILQSPEIAVSNGSPGNSVSQSTDRYDLFAKFVRLVSRYDPRLSMDYSRRYSSDAKDPSSVLSLWEAAYEILDEDKFNSIRLAERASAAELFPDIGLVYLERLRVLDAYQADRLASQVIAHANKLSSNSRLMLLTYVFPFPRVPEIGGGRLLNRTVIGRPDISRVATNPALARQLIKTIVQSGGTGQEVVLELLEQRIGGNDPALFQLVTRRQIDLHLTDSDRQRVSNEVTNWLRGYDVLEQSIERSEASFQSSRNEKYRNRATLLRGLSLSQSGDYSAALATISELPLDSRPMATKAVLLYAAGAVTKFERATDLINTARSSSRDRFVVGYCLLAAARLAVQKRELLTQQLPSLIGEVDQVSGQIDNLQERISLRLGMAMIRTKIDRDAAYRDLNTALKEIESNPSENGLPMVHIVLPVSGTVIELDIPSGKASLYQVVRALAPNDLERTLGNISAASRDDIRLRCIVAACAAFLSQNPVKIKQKLSSATRQQRADSE